MEDLPIQAAQYLSRSLLLKRHFPRNVEEGVRYCHLLLDHYGRCNTACKCMAKKGPLWVLQRLADVADDLTLSEIKRELTSSTDLFSGS